MSATVTSHKVYAAARELRYYAQTHHLPKDTILRGCKAARQAIADGRTIAVAVFEGQKAMQAAPLAQGARA